MIYLIIDQQTYEGEGKNRIDSHGFNDVMSIQANRSIHEYNQLLDRMKTEYSPRTCWIRFLCDWFINGQIRCVICFWIAAFSESSSVSRCRNTVPPIFSTAYFKKNCSCLNMIPFIFTHSSRLGRNRNESPYHNQFPYKFTSNKWW